MVCGDSRSKFRSRKINDFSGQAAYLAHRSLTLLIQNLCLTSFEVVLFTARYSGHGVIGSRDLFWNFPSIAQGVQRTKWTRKCVVGEWPVFTLGYDYRQRNWSLYQADLTYDQLCEPSCVQTSSS